MPAITIEKLDPNFAQLDVESGLHWYDLRTLGVEGKGWQDTETFYDRLPARSKSVVREPVWTLSQRTAGMCVRFITDAPSISARWKLRFESLAMDHMPATGMSGLDLYVRQGQRWHWIGVGRPSKQDNQAVLFNKPVLPRRREYLLYLPLYNGVEEVSIGIGKEYELFKAPPSATRPICFYGTSIVQGGCASRPGMAYPAILSRRLNRRHLNLGFSGNGKSEPEVAQLLAELDVSAYVIDPLPNMQEPAISERIEPLARTLREARPEAPIVLVESITYQSGAFAADFLDRSTPQRDTISNAALRTAFNRLVHAGVPRLHLVPGAALLGDDGEATVDGTHPTDVGFMRIAGAIEPVLRAALEIS